MTSVLCCYASLPSIFHPRIPGNSTGGIHELMSPPVKASMSWQTFSPGHPHAEDSY
ncbi:hypothetical protein QET40_02310 [Akkermansia sp. N21169]|uniref:hypothetical protein n=1 Tax=Akkermansia sp. N21116 TaxID=3040764 RepID=UPI00244EB732|nr:hypothetical protein [Akkermansia sp. N21116]MDH3067935.1 hypothetical protein [Akkermansia sp. N21169]WPX39914.1 hypothetical protein QET93_010255 [Akkermansia sp. N21116]